MALSKLSSAPALMVDVPPAVADALHLTTPHDGVNIAFVARVPDHEL